jgi:hypothetical protein
MAESGITKLEAAGRQLGSALGLRRDSGPHPGLGCLLPSARPIGQEPDEGCTAPVREVAAARQGPQLPEARRQATPSHSQKAL